MALIVTRGGEAPQTMAKADYVLTCMQLANWRQGDSEKILTDSFTSIMQNRHARMLYMSEAHAREKTESAAELSTMMRNALTELVSKSRDTVLRRRRAKIDAQLEGLEVVTSLEFSPRGELIHLHRYFPHDNDAATALLIAHVLGDEKTYRDGLRLCALEGCGIFFLVKKNSSGGPRPKYCTPAHTEEADRLGGGDRQARHRNKQKRQKRKGAHS